ncbi:DUF6493 family protein [Actinomadura chokoriensis]|uniref:DUF6493 family protein n=1 Tax=Actinomadura chokoriensis TaxID=454156 RepID=A0ABV4QZF0_9ACTN
MPSATTTHDIAAWEKIAALIDLRDPGAVADAVRDLGDAERRTVARALPGHVKAVRARREPWEGIDEYAPAFRAAGAAALGGASAVAAWLTRREFNSRWAGEHRDTGLLLQLWDGRDDAWLADLARRLTLRLRGPRHIGLDLVLALLAETGIEPPDHDPLVVGWVSSGPPRAKDPLLPALLPRIFEAEGVGRELRDNLSWPRTLPTLAGRGVIDRRTLLDGCVRRFLRGGAALDLRFFVRLHGLLMPADPAAREREIRAYARDYVRLLPAAPGPVADLALGLLMEPAELPSRHVVEALDGVLFRAESGLVRSGLSWLEQTVRSRPELAGECAAALAQAFAHESYTVQARAVRIALKLPEGADTAALTDAVPLLAADLGAKAAARFGGAVAEPEPEEDPPPALSPPPAPDPLPPLPPPITRPMELTRTLSGATYLLGWPAIEQVMDAFVRLVRQNPRQVRAAFKLVRHPDFHPHLDEERYWLWPWQWLDVAGRLLTGSRPVPADWRDRLPPLYAGAPPHVLYLHRCAELAVAVADGALPPLLLAVPTEPTGHLDPGTFVERLEILQAAGAEPGPADLQQALLRLPREIDRAAVRRAAALTSPAGRVAARWLAEGGLPAPEVSVRPLEKGWPEPVIDAGPTGLPLVDAVFASPKDVYGRYSFYGQYSFYGHAWSRLLPTHPEVAAAYVLRHMPRHGGHFAHGGPVGELIDLSPGDGPFAEAVAHLLALQLVERHSGNADKALLTMAARGDLPATALGRHIGRLLRTGEIRPSRIIEALERAADAGAYTEVWAAIAAALPIVCPKPGERPVHALDRLLVLGLKTARWSGARGTIAEVERLAARKGSSNLVREARALAAHLAAAN